MMKTWDNISLKQFNELLALGEEPNIIDVIGIVYEVDARELPVSKLSNYRLDFLSKDIPRKKIRDYYKINGTKYIANFDITKITAAQFVDFKNYCSNGANLADILTVCLVPEGHTYSDGYDINKVKEDALSMPITEANTVGFFFLMQSLILLESIQSFLKEEDSLLATSLDLASSIVYRCFYDIVKKPTSV